MAKASVLVLYNQPLLPRSHPDAVSELSVVWVAEAMAQILRKADYRVTRLPLRPNPAILWKALKKHRPDVVFNLFEGNHDHPESEAHVAGLLEWSGIPYTGSPPPTLSLARVKHTVKYLLKGAALPTADFVAVSELPFAPCPLEFPVIVKPAAQDGSVGVHQASVCVNRAQLERRVAYVLQTYGAPALVEAYIPGRELNVALVELPTLQPLRPTEIALPTAKPGTWPILTYDGKWKPGSPMYEATSPHYPADLSAGVVRKLHDLALKAYRLVGCRDYARVDFRMNDAGKIYILEVNPNPEIGPTAGLVCGLGTARHAYQQFIVRLVEHALTRRNASGNRAATT